MRRDQWRGSGAAREGWRSRRGRAGGRERRRGRAGDRGRHRAAVTSRPPPGEVFGGEVPQGESRSVGAEADQRTGQG
jgi:hypothetical protein